MYRCHIEAALKNLELNEVKRTHIQELISLLPPQTAQMTLAVLKTIYREALAQELVEFSPAHGVRGQKVIVAPRRFLTWDEIDRSSFGRQEVEQGHPWVICPFCPLTATNSHLIRGGE